MVKQLQSTLRYAHYGLMTATVQRTKPGNGINGSGVAEPTLLGMTVREGQPILYNYRLRRITTTSGERPSIDIENFDFSMRVPINVGGTSADAVPVHRLRYACINPSERKGRHRHDHDGRRKALIVVVTATVVPKR